MRLSVDSLGVGAEAAKMPEPLYPSTPVLRRAVMAAGVGRWADGGR